MTNIEHIANEVYDRHMPHNEAHSENEYRGNLHDQAWSQIVEEDDRKKLLISIRNGFLLGAVFVFAVWVIYFMMP